MTGTAQRSFYIIVILSILVGCLSSVVAGGPAAAQSESQVDIATPPYDLYVAPVDATPHPHPSSL